MQLVSPSPGSSGLCHLRTTCHAPHPARSPHPTSSRPTGAAGSQHSPLCAEDVGRRLCPRRGGLSVAGPAHRTWCPAESVSPSPASPPAPLISPLLGPQPPAGWAEGQAVFKVHGGEGGSQGVAVVACGGHLAAHLTKTAAPRLRWIPHYVQTLTARAGKQVNSWAGLAAGGGPGWPDLRVSGSGDILTLGLVPIQMETPLNFPSRKPPPPQGAPHIRSRGLAPTD